jgi:hypothetical protein
MKVIDQITEAIKEVARADKVSTESKQVVVWSLLIVKEMHKDTPDRFNAIFTKLLNEAQGVITT